MTVSNSMFLSALFGDSAPFAHVTDFHFDPANIPPTETLRSWSGDHFSRYQMSAGTNQYFTISVFGADEYGKARRRKSMFQFTPVIVLDDVREKLILSEVQKLPAPSWILETSSGSEQWGYILDKPCEDRATVENLLDGLVSNGLAPGGKDPGMKGVTRYVRLPEGSNSKSSKLVGGLPFKCQLTLWEPTQRVTVEQLAAPLKIDLHAARREFAVDGAADISDHPIINVNDLVHVKEVRSDGRFDVTCPWVDEHTGSDDSGSAVFTNADGTLGFKCHHGACQHRTGKHLLQYVEGQTPGFRRQLKNWQSNRAFNAIAGVPVQPAINFMVPTQPVTPIIDFMAPAQPAINFMAPAQPTPPTSAQPAVVTLTPSAEVGGVDAIQQVCDELGRMHPSSQDARDAAAVALKHVSDLAKIDQTHWHAVICDIMCWSKGDFKTIIKELREQWVGDRVNDADFYNDIVFIKELNQFYDYKTMIFFTPDAFQNSFGHEDADAKKEALQNGRVEKVDKLDYAPLKPRTFIERHTVYANTWSDMNQPKGVPGSVARWYDHFDTLGWGQHRQHFIQWMAFTIRHPDIKINHMMLLGSGEGCGKDFLLYPLAQAMAENHTVISGDDLLSDFNDYLMRTKYLQVNEVDLGDRNEALIVGNKLKPIATAPPDSFRINQKGIKAIKVRNVVNGVMTANSVMPVKLKGASRRFLALWSDLDTRDDNGDQRPEWINYWNDRWQWMKGEDAFADHEPGWSHVVDYLINEVDLSTFKPSEPPPVTDYLREITDAGKSAAQQTVESFITSKHGAFRSDLVTATDLANTLRFGETFAQGDMYCDGRYFSPIKTGKIVKEIGRHNQRTCYYLGNPVRLWVIRNHSRYANMTSKELYAEYTTQMNAAKAAIPLQSVG